MIKKSENMHKRRNYNLEESTNRKIINFENNIVEQNKNELRKNNKDNKDNNKNIKDEEFGWYMFFCYLIHLKRNNPKIKYYEEIREQIISEESLFQNYINIFNLLKINKNLLN